MDFWSPQIHYIATLIHIFAIVFWLGWMVFIFFILQPVAMRVSSINPQYFMPYVRQRVRKFVFWIIIIVILTGLYNMGYRGLLDWQVLTGTAVGHRMLWKLGAAAVLFGIYFIAPYVMGGHTGDNETEGHKPPKKAKLMVVGMHVIAFSAGVAAAYLGITIGG